MEPYTQPQKGSDRRRAERLKIPLHVILGSLRKKESQIKGDCLEISGMGIRVLTDDPLRENKPIEVSLDLGDGKPPCQCACRVIWCKELENGKYHAGLSFDNIKHNERLTQFLGDYLLNLSVPD